MKRKTIKRKHGGMFTATSKAVIKGTGHVLMEVGKNRAQKALNTTMNNPNDSKLHTMLGTTKRNIIPLSENQSRSLGDITNKQFSLHMKPKSVVPSYDKENVSPNTNIDLSPLKEALKDFDGGKKRKNISRRVKKRRNKRTRNTKRY